MKTLIEYITHYLQDGKPRRLVHIAYAVKSMGWEAGISNQYMGVYQCLHNHPELFKKVGPAMYQLLVDTTGKLDLDQDQIREVIVDFLKKRPKQTASQIWYRLQAYGVAITYNATQYLLQSDMFKKDGYLRYSNEK